MLSSFWKKTDEKKKRRLRLEEETNREGHWVRDFSVRQESWPLIEHWASEHGFRLAAMKGRRRLYQKGDESSWYQTFVDFRHDENRVVVSSWIVTGFKMRSLTLFLVPRELHVDPQGSWKGVRVRRNTCRTLNVLLTRFRQPEIVASQGFHITDIDLSTLFLAVLLAVPVHVFLGVTLVKLQLRTGLSNTLLMAIGNKTQTLLIAAFLFLIVHHFGTVKFFNRVWAKALSAGVFTLLLSILTVFVGTRTRSEMQVARLVHHCVMYYDEGTCGGELKSIDPKDRETLVKRISLFEHHLTVRAEKVAPPKLK